MIRPNLANKSHAHMDPGKTVTVPGAELITTNTNRATPSTLNSTQLLGELLRQLLDQKHQSTPVRLGNQQALEHTGAQPQIDAASNELLEVELDGTVYKVTVTTWAQPPTPPQATAKDLYPDYRVLNALSPREHEIVRLVARGLPNKTIATILEISSWTVATHLRRVFAKLEVTTRAAMVARAAEAGLLTT